MKFHTWRIAPVIEIHNVTLHGWLSNLSSIKKSRLDLVCPLIWINKYEFITWKKAFLHWHLPPFLFAARIIFLADTDDRMCL